MTGYNVIRSAEELLDKYESDSPSFTIHLYPEHWTLNSGPKFLYNHPVASLLDDVRSHRIPVDYLELFDSAHVPFYDGCMLVELLDYRPKKAKDPPLDKPERSRVTLHPNDETLWADLCLMNQRTGCKLTDPQVLEVEAQILLHTSPPLCLDPDPHLTRIANHTLRVSTPSIPVSLKRKIAAITQEEDESEKARRAKIIQYMNPRLNRSHVANYPILDVMKRVREKRQAEAQALLAKAIANAPNVTNNRSTPVPTTQATPIQPSHTTISTTSTANTNTSANTSTASTANATNTNTSNTSSSTAQPPVPTSQPPVPTSQPPVPTSQPSIPTSQPPANGSKPRPVKKEPGGSSYPNTPENPRATVTPVPHPVVNQLQTQQPIRSPPVHSRSPIPLNNSYQQHPAGTPMNTGSPAQRGYTQSPRPPSQTPHPHSSPLAPGSQLPTPDHRANPGGVHFIQMAPGASQSKPSTPQLVYSTQVPPPPQQTTTQPHPPQATQAPASSPQTQPAHANMSVAQYYALRAHVAHSQAQAAQVQQAQVAQAHNQVPSQGQMPTQMTQVTQHPGIPAQYNFAQQYRPMNAPANPHPQVAHMAPNQQQNMGAQGQVMDGQQQMVPQYAMYSYPVGYGMAGGRLPAQYAWTASGMGRLPNGQPGMQPGHPQMPVAQGKAAQAGVPGR